MIRSFSTTENNIFVKTGNFIDPIIVVAYCTINTHPINTNGLDDHFCKNTEITLHCMFDFGYELGGLMKNSRVRNRISFIDKRHYSKVIGTINYFLRILSMRDYCNYIQCSSTTNSIPPHSYSIKFFKFISMHFFEFGPIFVDVEQENDDSVTNSNILFIDELISYCEDSEGIPKENRQTSLKCDQIVTYQSTDNMYAGYFLIGSNSVTQYTGECINLEVSPPWNDYFLRDNPGSRDSSPGESGSEGEIDFSDIISSPHFLGTIVIPLDGPLASSNPSSDYSGRMSDEYWDDQDSDEDSDGSF